MVEVEEVHGVGKDRCESGNGRDTEDKRNDGNKVELEGFRNL